MKKTAIVLAAAATFLTSISISAPATAASWDWGFSSPFFSYHHDRSVGSRHLSGRDSVRVGPWRWSGGFGLGRDHADRCFARYRSYDSATDTYVTFGGERKRCRL
ncbi:MAG TPA: BA14K family protein [Devosia sp.]